jgi:hypothetical protein
MVLQDEKVNTDTRIACIFFAYANSSLIEVLKRRGNNLVNGKLHQMYKTEDMINQLIHERHEEFKRPVKAFVSFNSQEGHERCMEYVFTTKNFLGQVIYNESLYALTLLDEKLEVKEATEPSDLIWENLQVDWFTIRLR